MNCLDHHRSVSPSSGSIAGSLSRRGFLQLAGITTATLALGNDSLAGALTEPANAPFPSAQIAQTHDLPSLPNWGPYSKKYFGVSHIPDLQRGLSFDLSIFPVPAYGPVVLPSVMDRSGVHPWEASSNLEFYSLRLETMWKDQLYCDLSFSHIDVNSRLIRMEMVNQTSMPQELVLNSLAQLCFPPLKEGSAEPIRLCEVELPEKAVWVHGLNYADLRFAKTRPTDNLVPDGKWRAEERCHNSVGGSVVAQGFGQNAGDQVWYRLKIDRPLVDAVLIWRFRLGQNESVSYVMDGPVRREIILRGTGEFSTVIVPLGALRADTYEVRFISNGGASAALNGFAVVEADQARQLRFAVKAWRPIPEVSEVSTSGLVLKYPDLSNYYGFSVGTTWASHRQIKWKDLQTAMDNQPGWRTRSRILGDAHDPGDPDSLFIHARSTPFSIQPHSKRTVYGMVCTGTEAAVRRSLKDFDPDSKTAERAYFTASRKAFHPIATRAGEQFKLSQQLLAAVTMTNLVYPLRTQGNYIRHYSPGRKWDCLYTWDSGFTGLGLLEIDSRCATEILNAYTTPSGAQSAFIHHGTPLPVQIYLCCELWNRTQSREMLLYFYPRLRQFHRFLAGRLGSSTTRQHRDHLICTWDYFYNSGGWDDYPPQQFVHKHSLTSSVAPVINTSHTIRCAKLLRQIAAELDQTEDLAEYERDITELSASLQRFSWDSSSGYYGYVTHNRVGEPTGILRTDTGVNFNMGLDGVYPLIAGICSPEQERRILDHLFSSQHLWTEIGITTVDQSAPYYNPDGYWNGSVWLAHQWFLWKTMLDLDRPELAIRIAQAGLAIWKTVADASYNCVEHFKPYEPYGLGWPQLSSLSSPALSWFAAMYSPGHITCGFDIWIEDCQFSSSNRRLQAKFKSTRSGLHPRFSTLVCMQPASRYQVLWNGVAADFSIIHDGLLQVRLPHQPLPGKLDIYSL